MAEQKPKDAAMKEAEKLKKSDETDEDESEDELEDLKTVARKLREEQLARVRQLEGDSEEDSDSDFESSGDESLES